MKIVRDIICRTLFVITKNDQTNLFLIKRETVRVY